MKAEDFIKQYTRQSDGYSTNIVIDIEDAIQFAKDFAQICIKQNNLAKKLAQTTKNVAIEFGKWIHIHSKEASNTVAPCRYYKNQLLNIEELFQEFLKTKQ